MKTAWQRLQQAFVDDHREMTRGYQSLLRLLDERNFSGLAEEAERLDRLVGPHIDFEEKYLYPELQRTRGEEYVSKLLHEHDDVLSAITELQKLTPSVEPTVKQIDRWITNLLSGIEHASTCGTLLSELQLLPDQRKVELLDGLTRLRDKGSRWTQLHPANA